MPTPPPSDDRSRARDRFVALERGHRTLRSVVPTAVSSVGVLLAGLGLTLGGPALWGGSVSSTASPPALEQQQSLPPSPAPSEEAGRFGGPEEPAEPSAPPAPPLEPSDPAGLRIPAIDVEAGHLLPLQVRSDGELDVPEEAGTVGWYEAGASPGQQGASVIGAHVDSPTGPAVFFRLAELQPGDEVTVPRADGVDAVFEVYGVEQYSKDDFPTRKVYGSTEGRAELRLVTCGGTFEQNEHGYSSNVVVYADLVSKGGMD
ncbi:class F sortase [Nocardiopsis xinjiangensis]|uniref:class F sortase n=1 Tax=Nocardiopsis xinjiangensis TaxID=124285 RepID=UPI001376BB1D|nr:class F sortase [Nocardiopsis xinjiangensis]